MKCPDCGKELNKNYECKNCGKKIEPHQPDIEVEYKEFKLSEFLEIRRKKNKSHPEDYSTSTIKNIHIPKTAIDGATPTVRQDKAWTAIKKKSVIVFLAVLAGFAAIAGAFLLIRFLF
ncbi:MAG: TFIIB-type zinc ribbon-containing protein [Nitrospirae bacterium]|jgi:methionyl-tRNA synthetase|nr:TFIIB-type zinc ribbon-containing protein [Nitrospirota bacterium]